MSTKEFAPVFLCKEGGAMHPDDLHFAPTPWTKKQYKLQLEAYYKDNPGERERLEGTDGSDR